MGKWFFASFLGLFLTASGAVPDGGASRLREPSPCAPVIDRWIQLVAADAQDLFRPGAEQLLMTAQTTVDDDADDDDFEECPAGEAADSGPTLSGPVAVVLMAAAPVAPPAFTFSFHFRN